MDQIGLSLVCTNPICPDQNIMAYYHLGSLRIRQGALSQALDLFRTAKSIAKREKGDSDSALLGGISFHIAECQLKMGNKRLALSGFKKCLELIPKHRMASKYLKKLDT